MATIYNHIRTSTIDDNGNVDVLYPETTGADVSVDRSNNNKIPAVATDAQALANNLSSSAFESPIDDSVTGADSAWSSEKINTRSGNVDLKVGADNGLHFTNSVGEDYILDLTKAVGTATAAQVLSGYTFSNASKLGLSGEMTNNGQVVYTLNPGETQTIPQGYHDGTGYITVPENTGTYTYAPNTTGATVDLGATNTYRYVNAENVYNYGVAQGTTVHTGTYTLTEEDFDSTVDMGVDHSYRYISVPAGGTTLESVLLWSNPSPTDMQYGFTATLSDSIDNYDYIQFVVNYSSSNSTQTSTIYDVTTLKTFSLSGSASQGMVGFGANTSGQPDRANMRKIAYTDTNQITFSNGLFCAATGSNPQWAIPVSIYGIKRVLATREVNISNLFPGFAMICWSSSGLQGTYDIATSAYSSGTSISNYVIISGFANARGYTTLRLTGAQYTNYIVYGIKSNSALDLVAYKREATSITPNVTDYDYLFFAVVYRDSVAITVKLS